MTGTGKLELVFVVFIAFGAGSGLAGARSQDQGNPPAAQGISVGLLVKRVQPKYPEKARQNRIQGTVVLHALISKEGDIVDLSAVSGDPLLVKSAVKAVK
jgi:protein TonB